MAKVLRLKAIVLIMAVSVSLLASCAPQMESWTLDSTLSLNAAPNVVLAFIALNAREVSEGMRPYSVVAVSNSYVLLQDGTSRRTILFSASGVGETTRLTVTGERGTSQDVVQPVLASLRQRFL